MKIVINARFGGFVVPDALIPKEIRDKAEASRKRRHAECKTEADWRKRDEDIDAYLHAQYEDVDRTDPEFIAKVEALSKEDREALKIVEIPDGSFWRLLNYDGAETIYYSASEIFTA